MNQVSLPIRRLAPRDVDGLSSLFTAFERAGYQKNFHPHLFDRATASEICASSGRDYYCCGWDGPVAVSYGMLRGFDGGYAVPSLGIATHPNRCRAGLARNMMHHLHSMARMLGATKIMLKVYPENHAAIDLYASVGYVFEQAIAAGQRIGYCTV